MNTNTIVKIKNLNKEYSDNALDLILFKNITFDLMEQTFSSILAPLNSNKTLLMKIIAGLEKPDSGIIDKMNNQVLYIPPQPSSFPWLNVKDNIEIGMRFSKSGKSSQIQEIIDLVGLHGYEEHFPNNKSIGFRLRIALGRALAANPKLILLDEPLNKMDYNTKSEMYILLRQVFITTGISFLLATSNISEAVFLSDRIVILSQDSGIIYDVNISLPESRNMASFANSIFKEKVKEIEDLVKIGEALMFNSFLI